MVNAIRDHWTLISLEEHFPSVRWRDPIMAHWSDGAGGSVKKYCCRVCIANRGLNWASEHQWNRFVDCTLHIEKEHGDVSSH